jgi:hypothetical protein
MKVIAGLSEERLPGIGVFKNHYPLFNGTGESAGGIMPPGLQAEGTRFTIGPFKNQPSNGDFTKTRKMS